MARRKESAPKPKTAPRLRAEAEYRRERGRIMNTIARAKKAGYEFDENLFIPLRQRDLPEMTTVKLKSLTRELKKIKTKEVRLQATNLSDLDVSRIRHDETVSAVQKTLSRSKKRRALEQARFQQKYKREIAKLIEAEQQENALRAKYNIGEPLGQTLVQQPIQEEIEVETVEPITTPEAVINSNQQLWTKQHTIDPWFVSEADFEAEREYQKEVRKYNRAYQKALKADPSLTKDEFDVRWRTMKSDAEVLRRARKELSFRNKFEVGESAYRQVLSMIKDVDAVHKQSADYLKNLLEAEIKTYGRDKVIQSIANAPDYLIEASTIVLYYKEGSSSFNDAVSSIQKIITGDIPSAEESAKLAEITDGAVDSDEELE